MLTLPIYEVAQLAQLIAQLAGAQRAHLSERKQTVRRAAGALRERGPGFALSESV